MIVFMDMDGVVCDFIFGIHQLGISPSSISSFRISQSEHGYNGSNLGDYMNINTKLMEREINLKGELFWINLPPIKEGLKLYQEIKSDPNVEEIYFLSNPSLFKGACDGKIKWLFKYFLDPKFIFTKNKELLIGENRLLIDDLEYNLNPWINSKINNCTGISFPNDPFDENKIEEMYTKLGEYLWKS